MIRMAIEKIVNKEDLTYRDAYAVMSEILNKETSVQDNAAFLAALSTKTAGPKSLDEITGCASAMRDHVCKVEHGMDVMEIIGTGGDRSSSFNISTTSAFVAASAGIKVAKHGGRASSSKSGTADCLEALGAKISLEPEKCVELLKEVGFCFLYARKYHEAMNDLEPLCRGLGFRTVFNILEPLVNPAMPVYYMLGVYNEYLVELLARVLVNIGVRKGLVVSGQDQLDEISMCAPTTVCEIRDGFYKTYVISPEDFGFRRCSREELVGGTPEVNADITRDILSGRATGPKRNIVLLNAGAAIYAANAADSIDQGIDIAADCIDSGKALKTMEDFVRLSH